MVFFLDGLANDLHQILLEGLLLHDKSILVPDEVWYLRVPAILLHTSLEFVKDVFVVGLVSELELSAVVHEILEFIWMTFTEFIHSDFKLLLLDVVVLLILGPAWKPLPW